MQNIQEQPLLLKELFILEGRVPLTLAPSLLQNYIYQMDGRTPIQRELSHLERIQTRKMQANTPIRIGFNQKRKAPQQLRPLHQKQLDHLLKVEQQLLSDIKEIDRALQKQHLNFTYHNGYLFTRGLDHDLAFKFRELITSKSQSVESGFSLWRVKEQGGTVRLVSGKLGTSPPNFSRQLTEKSLEKLIQYHHNKHQQSIKKAPKPWEYFSRSPKHLRLQTEDNLDRRQVPRKLWPITHIRQQTEINRKYTDNPSSSIGQSGSMSGSLDPLLARSNQLGQSCKALYFNQLQPPPSRQQLQKMLLKQNKIVSIWTPPSNYPQLLAVLSIQIREKDVNVRSCWLMKYYISKHAFNRRLTGSILDWACQHCGSVDELVTTTTKANFDSIFSGQGWKISCWIKENRLRIVYRRVIF